MTATKVLEVMEKHEDLDRLRSWCPPGTKVYCVLRHASSSGMSRSISFFVLKDNRHVQLDRSILQVGIGKFDRKHDGIKVGGCGMDMGLHVVYNLSRMLYPKGFGCIGEDCPSNDHTNGDRDYSKHLSAREGPLGDMTPEAQRKYGVHWHAEGGYALRHSWL